MRESENRAGHALRAYLVVERQWDHRLRGTVTTSIPDGVEALEVLADVVGNASSNGSMTVCHLAAA